MGQARNKEREGRREGEGEEEEEKERKKERRSLSGRTRKEAVWVPYGQVTVIYLQCIFWEIMQTNNACEWQTKTGAPRELANPGPSRGDTSWGPTTRGFPPVRIHTYEYRIHSERIKKHRYRIHQTRKYLLTENNRMTGKGYDYLPLYTEYILVLRRITTP